MVVSFWLGIFITVNFIPSKKTEFRNQGYETIFYRLAEQKVFKSEFVASLNNLKRIDVLFKNPNLESRDELVINVLEEDKLIYTQNFSAFNFGDTSHARLDFVSRVNSLNKKYTVEIIPTKIVDGKLYFGVKNGELDVIFYYANGLSVKNSWESGLRLISNWIILLPLLSVTLWLW